MREKNISFIKGKKGQQLNQREVYAISDGSVPGLLLFDVENHGYKYAIRYRTDGLISFLDFLRMNIMSRRLFVIILRNMIVVLKGIEEKRFSKDLLMWTLGSAYIEPSTWHLYMMYVPLQTFETSGNFKSFLLDTVSHCNFDEYERIDYVQKLVHDINSATSYTVGMLETYCDKITEELLNDKNPSEHKKICSYCGSKLMEEDTACPFCGKNLGTGRIHRSYQTQVDELFEDLPKSITFNEDENGVVTVFRGSKNVVQSIWFEDCIRSEKITLSTFPVRIGKLEGISDFVIQNPNVSRKHADLIKEQGKYYLVDLASTNGTFLNGRRLQPGVKEVLSDGMLVKFASCEYKIHLD